VAFNAPLYARPIGVRAVDTITASFMFFTVDGLRQTMLRATCTLFCLAVFRGFIFLYRWKDS
jgi:hypothetical protein